MTRPQQLLRHAMSDDLLLRPFRPDDTPALIALFRDTVHRVNCRDYTPEQVRAWAPDDVDPARWAVLSDRHTVVAEANGVVVGFTDMEPNRHIDRFFVHADHQGRGVGRTMLYELVSVAGRRGIRQQHAEVSITARPFFRLHGSAVVAEQEVTVRGVVLTNYRMERLLRPPSSSGEAEGSPPDPAS